jgi:glycine/D-amino acid oxidase-like deaminating enzyme
LAWRTVGLLSAAGGNGEADVYVVGGGSLGIWAALEVVEEAPDAKMVLIEAEAEGCGFGARGRNGGWITRWHDALEDLVARFGVDRARWLAERSTWPIDRLAEMCEQEGIGCHLRRTGGFGLRRRWRRWGRGRVRLRRARVSGGRGSSRGWVVASFVRGPDRR